MRFLLILAALMLAPSVVRADPCEGSLPERAGTVFGGTVRYVGDGDSLCVGQSADPATWIEVRLSDHDAIELNDRGGRQPRDALVDLAMGRTVRCTVVRGRNGRVRSWDRVITQCRINGTPLARLLRERAAITRP